jgi:hypothetical protein
MLYHILSCSNPNIYRRDSPLLGGIGKAAAFTVPTRAVPFWEELGAIAFIGSDPGITGKFYRRDRPLLGGIGNPDPGTVQPDSFWGYSNGGVFSNWKYL